MSWSGLLPASPTSYDCVLVRSETWARALSTGALVPRLGSTVTVRRGGKFQRYPVARASMQATLGEPDDAQEVYRSSATDDMRRRQTWVAEIS